MPKRSPVLARAILFGTALAAAVPLVAAAQGYYPPGPAYRNDGPPPPSDPRYDPRYDPRRPDDRRPDDRRYDDRRDDNRGHIQQNQRQDLVQQQVRDAQTRHNQGVVQLQQQFNQRQINRDQMNAGIAHLEQTMNAEIQRAQQSGGR